MKSWWLGFVILQMLFLEAAFSAPKEKIRIGVEFRLPYIGLTETEKLTGYIFDILESVAAKYSYQFEYVDVPIPRQKQSLEKGGVDYVIVPRMLVRYLPDVAIVSSQFGVSFAGVLTVRDKGPAAIFDFTPFANKITILSYMGPETDTLLEDLLNQAGGTKTEVIEISGLDVPRRMVLMLTTGRGDLAFGDYNVLRFSAAQVKGVKTKVIPTSNVGFGAVVLVTRKNKKGFENFEANIASWFQTARKDGRLKAILNKYNLTDWEILEPRYSTTAP